MYGTVMPPHCSMQMRSFMISASADRAGREADDVADDSRSDGGGANAGRASAACPLCGDLLLQFLQLRSETASPSPQSLYD